MRLVAKSQQMFSGEQCIAEVLSLADILQIRDVANLIFAYLHLKDLYHLSQASKAYRNATQDHLYLPFLDYFKRYQRILKGGYIGCTDDNILILNANGKVFTSCSADHGIDDASNMGKQLEPVVN